MWRLLALAGVTSFALCASSRADDRPLLQRIAERAPVPRVNIEHSAERAGYPLNVKRHAVPSVTRFDQGGYVGGGSLRNNSLIARGPGSAVGPTQDGTYGTDFGGFRAHLGRVFLASSDSSYGHPAYLSYRTDGPRIVDVFAIRPLRNGILAKREAAEEMHHGKEEHGAGGHGAEGHAPEGGEKKGGGH